MPDVFKAIKPLEAKPEPEVAQPLFGVASLTNQMVQAGWLGRPLAKPSDDVKPDVARVVAFGKAIYDDV